MPKKTISTTEHTEEVTRYLELKTFSDAELVILDKKYSVEEAARILSLPVPQTEFLVEAAHIDLTGASIVTFIKAQEAL